MPIGVGHDAAFRCRCFINEHADEFEHVAIRIAKVDGRSGHPGEDLRLAGGLTVEVQRHDSGGD